MIVNEYIEEFYKVSIRAGQIQDTYEKVARYVNGLKMEIQDEISLLSPKTVEEAYQMVLKPGEKFMRKKSSRNRGAFQSLECPENIGINRRNEIVAKTEEEEVMVTEVENVPKKGQPFVVKKALLNPAKEIVEPSQRKTLFMTMWKVQGKCCQMIIDSGTTDNLVSKEVVEKLKLKIKKHPTCYKVSWVQKGYQLIVNE
eukprot:PITA_21439